MGKDTGGDTIDRQTHGWALLDELTTKCRPSKGYTSSDFPRGTTFAFRMGHHGGMGKQQCKQRSVDASDWEVSFHESVPFT